MIPVKTEAGIRVVKDRSVALTPRQRAAFILVDGKRSLAEVMASTAGMGVTQDDLDALMRSGLIMEVQTAEASAGKPPERPGATNRNSQERYRDAYLIATQITAGLGLRGFRLNLAVEAAGSFEQLEELGPRIKLAVSPEKFAAFDEALHA